VLEQHAGPEVALGDPPFDEAEQLGPIAGSKWLTEPSSDGQGDVCLTGVAKKAQNGGDKCWM
jgi:hypothetical protein